MCSSEGDSAALHCQSAVARTSGRLCIMHTGSSCVINAYHGERGADKVLRGGYLRPYRIFPERAEKVHVVPSLGQHMPRREGQNRRMFGSIPADYVEAVAEGAADWAMPISVNRILFDGGWDLIINIGHVILHEGGGRMPRFAPRLLHDAGDCLRSGRQARSCRLLLRGRRGYLPPRGPALQRSRHPDRPPLAKVVAVMQEDEVASTREANKAIYRMRLEERAPGVQRLEPRAAHILHGSTEGRFKVTYAPGTCPARILSGETIFPTETPSAGLWIKQEV